MATKIKLIDRAYSKLVISGITVDPTADDVVLAVEELECMAQEWQGRNICLSFNFEDCPKCSSESGVPKRYENAVITNLALRLAPDFGKAVDDQLYRQARQSLDYVSGASMREILTPPPYPRRQPIGEANTLKWNRWRRYYDVVKGAPENCATQIMVVGDRADFTLNFSEVIQTDAKIFNYTLDYSDGLRLLEESSDEKSVSFSVEAVRDGTQKVTVTVQSSPNEPTLPLIPLDPPITVPPSEPPEPPNLTPIPPPDYDVDTRSVFFAVVDDRQGKGVSRAV